MNIREFGDQLIETGDLDPVYIGLWRAEIPHGQLARLFLAYWCFYHLGVACYMSEMERGEYWLWMLQAARNADQMPPPKTGCTRWPRSAERRHFRGEKCVKAVEWFSVGGHPEDWAHQLVVENSASGIMRQVSKWPQFGPWIAFKAADMMERVWGTSTVFNMSEAMYDEPLKGLKLSGENLTDLVDYFSRHDAPPRGGRPCSFQEVETICCKYKSMNGGHYHIGKDIHEVRHGLKGWGDTAMWVLDCMPREV